MSNLIDVEYSYELQQFVAVFDDGDVVALDADNLNDARREAERIVDYG